VTIKTQGLFDDLADEFGCGSGNASYIRRFPRAVNRAMDELSVTADLATRHTHISNVDSSISTLDSELEPYLYWGTKYWLIHTGQRPSDPRLAVAMLKETGEAWEDAKGMYAVERSNDSQATDSNSMWGLGYIDT